MKHIIPPDEMTEMAAFYSLGALSQQEARAFENHLAEGCEACRKELASFEATLTAVAFAEEAEAPSVKVRDRLVARLNEEAPSREASVEESRAGAAQFVSVRDSEGEWHQLLEGVLIKQLYVDSVTGITTSVVKMQPGTSLPMHRHKGVEQFYIIEGDCNVRGEVLGPGDYHRANAGSIHETTFTINGTMFLLVAPRDYEVINAR